MHMYHISIDRSSTKRLYNFRRSRVRVCCEPRRQIWTHNRIIYIDWSEKLKIKFKSIEFMHNECTWIDCSQFLELIWDKATDKCFIKSSCWIKKISKSFIFKSKSQDYSNLIMWYDIFLLRITDFLDFAWQFDYSEFYVEFGAQYEIIVVTKVKVNIFKTPIYYNNWKLKL